MGCVVSGDPCLTGSRPQVMWTGLPCQNFHLLVCCAILDSEKQKIMEENYGFNEILKVGVCSSEPPLVFINCWLLVEHKLQQRAAS